MLQVVCGKRAECIETRRERLLAEAPNKNVQGALRRIPPSSEYLFGKEYLVSLIQSLGGAQSWLRTPSYTNPRKPFRKREYNQNKPGSRQPMNNQARTSHQSDSRPDIKPNNNFKPRSEKRESFKDKAQDSFRKRSDK